MIQYRKYREDDMKNIIALLEKYGVAYDGRQPAIGLVAEGETEPIIGAALAHNTVIIEPFAAENKAAAVKLFYMMIGSLISLGAKSVLAHVANKNEVLAEELKKVGFEPLTESTIFKRIL